MSKLEIIQRQVTETAKEIVVNKATILYNYSYEQSQRPMHVGFSVIRGVEGKEGYDGNIAISGSLQEGSFEVRNENYQIGDAALYEAIHATCQTILNPTQDVDDSE